MSEFPEIFKRLRKEHKFSQYDLAKELDVSRSIIAMYEQGHRLPSFEMLEKIAKLFNVDVHYLMTGESQAEYLFRGPKGNEKLNTAIHRQLFPDEWIMDAYNAAPERVKDIVKLTLEPYRQEAESSDLKKA